MQGVTTTGTGWVFVLVAGWKTPPVQLQTREGFAGHFGVQLISVGLTQAWSSMFICLYASAYSERSVPIHEIHISQRWKMTVYNHRETKGPMLPYMWLRYYVSKRTDECNQRSIKCSTVQNVSINWKILTIENLIPVIMLIIFPWNYYIHSNEHLQSHFNVHTDHQHGHGHGHQLHHLPPLNSVHRLPDRKLQSH